MDWCFEVPVGILVAKTEFRGFDDALVLFGTRLDVDDTDIAEPEAWTFELADEDDWNRARFMFGTDARGRKTRLDL